MGNFIFCTGTSGGQRDSFFIKTGLDERNIDRPATGGKIRSKRSRKKNSSDRRNKKTGGLLP
ncbi:MAG: hypothetical protein D3914_18215 [Candidatus Electrothrix sp. LOE2]|nr:hypothetical protein [Candidatus Electrothrix sp. LOE2]